MRYAPSGQLRHSVTFNARSYNFVPGYVPLENGLCNTSWKKKIKTLTLKLLSFTSWLRFSSGFRFRMSVLSETPFQRRPPKCFFSHFRFYNRTNDLYALRSIFVVRVWHVRLNNNLYNVSVSNMFLCVLRESHYECIFSSDAYFSSTIPYVYTGAHYGSIYGDGDNIIYRS